MKRPVTVALCFVLLLVGITILMSRSATPAHAQVGCAIPKAYGTLRTSFVMADLGLLFFEAPDGTIRAIGPEKCNVVSTFQRR
jgi:hypothetical protein